LTSAVLVLTKLVPSFSWISSVCEAFDSMVTFFVCACEDSGGMTDLLLAIEALFMAMAAQVSSKHVIMSMCSVQLLALVAPLKTGLVSASNQFSKLASLLAFYLANEVDVLFFALDLGGLSLILSTLPGGGSSSTQMNNIQVQRSLAGIRHRLADTLRLAGKSLVSITAAKSNGSAAAAVTMTSTSNKANLLAKTAVLCRLEKKSLLAVPSDNSNSGSGSEMAKSLAEKTGGTGVLLVTGTGGFSGFGVLFQPEIFGTSLLPSDQLAKVLHGNWQRENGNGTLVWRLSLDHTAFSMALPSPEELTEISIELLLGVQTPFRGMAPASVRFTAGASLDTMMTLGSLTVFHSASVLKAESFALLKMGVPPGWGLIRFVGFHFEAPAGPLVEVSPSTTPVYGIVRFGFEKQPTRTQGSSTEQQLQSSLLLSAMVAKHAATLFSLHDEAASAMLNWMPALVEVFTQRPKLVREILSALAESNDGFAGTLFSALLFASRSEAHALLAESMCFQNGSPVQLRIHQFLSFVGQELNGFLGTGALPQVCC
jgi:hypothetical protein